MTSVAVLPECKTRPATEPHACCCKACLPLWVKLIGVLRARGDVVAARELEALLGVVR